MQGSSKATGMENIVQGEVSAKLWKSFARSEKALQLMRKFAQGGWEVVQGIENTAKVVESFHKGMGISHEVIGKFCEVSKGIALEMLCEVV